MTMTRILFVCMGNICRSPTAEAVMRKLVNDASLQSLVSVDSAGTHDYHVGAPPDPRAQAAARTRGYDLSSLRARQVASADFDGFDMLLAMDFNNLAWLQNQCPGHLHAKLGLLMPYAKKRRAAIVHDPYYRSPKDFDLVLDYIEDACSGLVLKLDSQKSKLDAAATVRSEQSGLLGL